MGTFELFYQGMAHFKSCNMVAAHECFEKAYHSQPPKELIASIQSYLGFTMVALEKQPEQGFFLMKKSVETEYYRSDIFINLARAYWFRMNSPRKALEVFQMALKFCPHDENLQAFWNQIGRRQPVVFRFLSRKNILNRWLGRHKKRLSSRMSH